MPVRKNPEVVLNQQIIRNEKVVGHIRLVNYFTENKGILHIEYKVYDYNRNQGIMSEELPKFLKENLEKLTALIAITKKDNLPSIKLLEKNNFLHLSDINDKYVYIIFNNTKYS